MDELTLLGFRQQETQNSYELQHWETMLQPLHIDDEEIKQENKPSTNKRYK